MITRRLATGVGQLANGLYLTLTLGLAPDLRLHYKTQTLEHRIRHRIRTTLNKREHTKSSLFITEGTYRTRDGRVMRVRRNTNDWYDKLEFVVCNERDQPLWTVDRKGWAYPFPHNFSKTPYDLVERV